MGHPIRAYVDTSVFGGVFDVEFAEASRAFFEQARTGRFRLLVSDVTRNEVAAAPPAIRRFFDELIAYMEPVDVGAAAYALRDAYMTAEVVGPRSIQDALQVAAATVARADIIVSWNFKHMVNVDKVRLYGAVNALNGFGPIDIRSPLEVIEYEEEV